MHFQLEEHTEEDVLGRLNQIRHTDVDLEHSFTPGIEIEQHICCVITAIGSDAEMSLEVRPRCVKLWGKVYNLFELSDFDDWNRRPSIDSLVPVPLANLRTNLYAWRQTATQQ